MLRGLLLLLIILAAAVPAIYILQKMRGSDPDPVVTSLAVLPFNDQAPGSDPSHLAAGFTVDLLDRLQLTRQLQCIPRAEILAQSSRWQDRRRLAKQLGAEILVSGTLRDLSGKVEVAVEILDARTGGLVAELRFEESRERIFDLQRQLAHQILAALEITLTAHERTQLDRDPTRSLKAWDSFAQGSSYLDDLVNPRAPTFATELLRRAVRLDPGFAQARARLSTALWLGFMHHGDPDKLREAEMQARRALENTPEISSAAVASALANQTLVKSEDSQQRNFREFDHLPKPDEAMRQLAANWLQVGELELSESAWLASIEVSPDNWLNSYGYGQFLLRGGRHGEAERAFARAAETTPRHITWPNENIVTLRLAAGDLAGAVEVFETIQRPLTGMELVRQMAAAYSILGRLEPAEILYRQALAGAPQDAKARQELGDVLTRSGRVEEAVTEYSKALEMLENETEFEPSDPTRQLYLSLFAAKAGECPRALPLAATLLRHLPQSAEAAHDLARVFAICGDESMALEALAKAIRNGLSPELIRSQSEFDWLSTHKEFERILANAEAAPPSP